MSNLFRHGAGEPLVLVHGFSNVWRVWEPVLPALTARHDVLAPTLRGHLGGEPLPAGAAVTVSALTDGVESAMDAAGFRTAHLCGHSMGGWIALDLARRGRARSVVCVAPAGGWTAGSRAARRLRRRFLVGHRLTALLEPRTRRLVARPGVRKLLFFDSMVHPERLTPAMARQRMRATLGCAVYRDLAEAMVRDAPPAWLAEVDAPVLLAWPQFDRLLPAEGHSESFTEQLRDAQWRDLPGTGHVPMVDDPDLVARTVLGWVAAHGSARHPSIAGGRSGRQ